MWPFPAGSSPIKPSVYGFWIGAYSDEPPSWYYAKVEKHYLTGQTKIEYSDLSTETSDLHCVWWERKMELTSSVSHTVKAFTDDL